MTDKQEFALKRLAKKLSAVRATLSKDERTWLDKIVLGVDASQLKAQSLAQSGAEVSAHQFVRQSSAKAKTADLTNPNGVLQFDPTSGGYSVKEEQ